MGNKGQSTLEYALVMAAILAALVAVAATVMRPAVQTSMTESAGTISGAANRVQSGLGL
jgi:uncharacterized protein (UPF0333 family)